MHNIHKAIATIILLVVVGLVGVQGSQLPMDAPSEFVTQYLIKLIIIIIGVNILNQIVWDVTKMRNRTLNGAIH